LTVPTASAETTARHASEAHAAVEAWTREKQARLAGAPDAGGRGIAGRDGAAASAAEVSDWGAMDA
jgi:hypothetical protein